MDATELKGKLGLEVYAAIVGRPWHLTRLSNLQRLVLTQLPGIANPKGVPVVPRKGKGRGGKAPLEQPGRDVLMIAAPNAGAKLAYIVPAVEHRLRSIKRFVADALARGGLHTDPATEERAAKIFTRGHAGVVIVTPTKERATEIGNQVLKTVHNHHEFQVQMLAGGVARKIQMRDWMQGRRDVVVGTPGRIRSLLEGEDEFARGMAKATMLIMDDTATALSLGLRDDLDAIAAYVAPREKRQTWIHTNELNLPLRQMVKSMLDEDYLVFKDLGVEKEVQPWEQVEQYHTVLPSGRDQLPHICRLIAHDQLANPGKSKVVIFTSGARVAQLFTTFLRALADSLPGGKDTNFYELHSGLTAQEREDVAQAWREDRSGCSVLLSSDFALKAEQYGTCTRVIQVGIPASSDVFKARLSRLADKGVKPRADLVLLNWEIGFLTWMLGEHPLKPCTTGRLQEEVEQKAAAFDADPAAVFPEDFALQEKRGLVPGEFTKFEGSVSERIKSVEKLYEELLPKMDELAIKETFASLLGFYIPKAGELRAQRPVIVQGVKQWAKECCGLAEEPYVSPEFLRRLGMDDGRTRHFGAAWLDRPTYKPGGAWLGRGIQRLKDRQVEERSWAGGAAELDPNDPVADPEMYRSTPYGKRADLAGRLLVPEEVKKSQQLAAIKAARKEMGLPVADLRTNPLEAEQSVNLPPLPRERRPAFGREHPEFAGFSAPQGASRAWPGGRSDSVAGMPFAAPSSVDAANLPFGESRPREAPRGPRRKEDGSSSRSGGGW
ncbi:hypothetical protein CALCODRAFT_437538 [Calocera cornea HHB12733]|uniref:ATP-dependent RNA helicase n=1 Tax=Calocera cornea HHB12733 TaxID=1353952 RepID=A0A165ENC7_9BASI|nr:hypothetical protein CALCODRAFT_437538 [Calocera cornea HHB12733]